MIKLFFLGVIGFPQVFILILIFVIIKYLFFNKKKKETVKKNFNEAVQTSKNVIENNINKAKKIAEQTVIKSYITNYNWLLVNDNSDNIIYTFRDNGELLITKNGFVERASFELIVDNNSILITKNNTIEHYNIVNQKNDFLILQLLSTENTLIFANQTKYKDYLKSQLKELAKESN